MASATQKPITLKCHADNGTPTVDLLIDLENREMKWGITRYGILKIAKGYITALEIQPHKTVGTEVFVVERSSGKYWRASVGMTCRGKGCTDYKMSANTYMGICQKIMF